MLLKEILGRNIDLSEFDKKVLINIKLAPEEGLNISSLYKLDKNPKNLANATKSLEKYKLIEETSEPGFYIITEDGLNTMKRASLIDLNGELIDANIQDFIYS
jgi:hypothetical protein